jgi:Ca2+-binding EF-hand superfamily protein
MFYVLANVFRYDVDGDGRITYDEMVNFFLEIHNGEMAIQRLHKKHTYERGAERIMKESEFVKTLTYALSFIHFKATDDELKHLFHEVDLDHDGWISYKEYFEFLRAYFGSQSLVYRERLTGTIVVKEYDPYSKLSLEERFARITIDQLLKILQLYKLQPFDSNEIVRILIEVFGLEPHEVEFALNNFFRYNVISSGYFLDTDVARILLELYFSELILLRLHRAKKFGRWQQK